MGKKYRAVASVALKAVCAGVVSVAVVPYISGCSAFQTTGALVGLDAYYGQSVDWAPCGDGKTGEWFAEPVAGVECAQVRAPLDYRNVRSPRTSGEQPVLLAVARRAATEEKKGTLLAISGGPGGTGLDLIEFAYPPEILAHFDIVAYDPRGVGRSTPLIQCAGGVDPDLDLAAEDTDAIERAELAEVSACMADTGLDVLRHIGSDEATNDVDLLRAVLGEERINLLAYSYGTQIAAMYALRFPANYRAAILDGVVDIEERPHEMRLGQERGFQATFTRLAAFCAGDYRRGGAECPLGTDPAAAEATFQQLLRDADARPVRVRDGSPVTPTDILDASYTGLLWPSIWGRYLAALQSLRHGDGTAIRRLAEFQDSEGTNALTAITCTDTADPTTDRAARHHEAAARYDAATYDNYEPRPAQFPLEDCDLWPFEGEVVPGKLLPVGPTRADFAARLLFVGTRHDPTTPVGNAERMARYMTSPLLVREGDGHTVVFGDENACIDVEAVRYLNDPDSVRDTTCA
ncbi:alpha/beta fold hydrolase [Nocardia sp. NPDC058666]|uniref:alpha/beta fold hydrolase n=1 Tax=Nocardia sp. NPDC058666 TaxID=3346587 RepID=UPI003668F0F5